MFTTEGKYKNWFNPGARALNMPPGKTGQAFNIKLISFATDKKKKQRCKNWEKIIIIHRCVPLNLFLNQCVKYNFKGHKDQNAIKRILENNNTGMHFAISMYRY